jgi:arabinan endo-1,5-alpha-L-arabinosidase
MSLSPALAQPRLRLALLVLMVAACGPTNPPDVPDDGAAPADATSAADAAPNAPDAAPDAAVSAPDASPDAAPPRCRTTITYGSAWIRPEGRTSDADVVDGDVRWDGVCTNEGSNSYAVLSNGWKPYFRGHSGCVIGIDHDACADVAATCTTRITYGASWLAPANHPNRHDVVAGRVTWNGDCARVGNESAATLSNGWTPHFAGTDACDMGFLYSQCGGLYANPVVPIDCPDPGVLLHDGTYHVVCTGGRDGETFLIHTSPDLVHFERSGAIFPRGQTPAWAKNRHWAPEVHRIGDHFVAYYSAAHDTSNGQLLSIGAARADNPLGPYTDLGRPLLTDFVSPETGRRVGVIDAGYFEDDRGQGYLLFKTDGNGANPREDSIVYAQRLAADGMSLIAERPTELLRNDLGWEADVVEGPWIQRQGGSYYLFYAGNGYASAAYAVGVARAASPLGPYVKKGDPILETNAGWQGPGHCSLTPGPGGELQMLYHAWYAGRVGGGNPRVLLVDPVSWQDGWPVMHAAPSLRSVPLP